jgi:Zn-dependent protease with chaperone function
MNFVTRSILVLLALYGLVFAIGDAFLMHENAPVWVAVAFVLVFVVAQFTLAPRLIEWVFSIDWDESALPAANRQFVEELCQRRGLPPLRFGVIHSGTPNAFSFGRFRKDARVVVTEGLLNILTVDEANAVLAHEIGHIEHYDFAIMTLAAAAPLVLYQMYVFGNRVKNLRAAAWCAYFAYIIGQFLVLTLNRTREYWADHYSAECTHAPGDLSSALVKIAYGMVKQDGEFRETLKSGSAEEKKLSARQRQFGGAMALMGISNLNSGMSLALTMANPQQAAEVMRWDLVNPWARVYELSSTHPLTALRVRALNETAEEMQLPVTYPLPDGPTAGRIRWGNFPIEFLLWIAPFACLAVLIFQGFFRNILAREGMELPSMLIPWLLIATGILWAVRIAFRYRGRFHEAKVQTLLEDLDVSQMTPRAVELRGEIIGNGVPGVFWSPDLVMQDETGQMFVLYRSSIPLGRLFFGLTNAYRFIGEQVTVRGWYRRGLRPYVELSDIRATVTKASLTSGGPISIFSQASLDAAAATVPEELHQRSYSRWIQLALSAAVAAVGVIWLLGAS